jgi:hypothetical protein
MEEILELRRSLEEGNYDGAMLIINEIEEMSRKDKINKIGSFLEVLLLHLMKQNAEGKIMRSWRKSIRNAVYAIQDTNERNNSGGVYCEHDEMVLLVERRYTRALQNAADEAFEGK